MQVIIASTLLHIPTYFYLVLLYFILPEGTRPNIVFVLTDNQGSHDIGYQGSLIKTPNLDHLAFQGVRLDNYYTHPLCTPSRVAIMTGRHVVVIQFSFLNIK